MIDQSQASILFIDLHTHQMLWHLCPELQFVGCHDTQNCSSNSILLVIHNLSVLITIRTNLSSINQSEQSSNYIISQSKESIHFDQSEQSISIIQQSNNLLAGVQYNLNLH